MGPSSIHSFIHSFVHSFPPAALSISLRQGLPYPYPYESEQRKPRLRSADVFSHISRRGSEFFNVVPLLCIVLSEILAEGPRLHGMAFCVTAPEWTEQQRDGRPAKATLIRLTKSTDLEDNRQIDFEGQRE